MNHNPRTFPPSARWHLGLMGCLLVSAAWAQAPVPAPAASAVQAPASAAEAPASSPAPAASATPAAATTPEPAVPAPPAVPRYSASDIKTIFNYLDRNKDGKISREEAAGFKGVARNFDRADTNNDGSLSSDEFTFAMNRAR